MSEAFPQVPDEFIVPLNMNKLRGRMLRLPAPRNKRKEILFIYGHHSTIERWYGLAGVLNTYGAVTMPDLPGFGGMDSFYKIGEKPTLDNLADYLASFIKLRYRNKRLTLIGFSFGFLVATRMLQNYPELAKKVDLVVSMSGFAHHEDFVFSKTRRSMYLLSSRLLSQRLPAMVFRNICLNPFLIRTIYTRSHNAREKFIDADAATFKANVEAEVHLWRTNDVQTHMFTSNEFLRVNNCKKQISVPAWHTYIKKDRYFDMHRVEQHLRIIFEDLTMVEAKPKNHSPTIIADKKEANSFFPRQLKQALRNSG